MKSRTFWLLLFAALIMGWVILWMRPTWEDTGLTAGMIFLSTLALGIINPKYPWLWALAVGSWLPLVGLLVTHNSESIMALFIAIIGSFSGALGRKFVSTLQAALT